MTSFFIDLWHDLREKRLWPVAVGLLAAIVAVPAILFKPASDAAPPATVAPKTNSADALPVVAVESGPNVGSHLEAFDQKNPFKPMKDLAKEDSGSSDSSSGSGSGGDSAASGSDATGGTSGGFGGSGSDTSGSTGGSPSTPDTSGSTGATPTTKWFHYTADFSFGAPGASRKYENVGSFELLPDEKTPSVVFIGIGGDHKTAMFFISDESFVADGEGDCNAKGDACRFVTLSLSDTSDEETFTSTDGEVTYNLKLLDINREELGTGTEPDAAPPATAGKGIATAGAGVATATGTAQSVVPPMFSAVPALAAEQQG
jgi:hypothetical protein